MKNLKLGTKLLLGGLLVLAVPIIIIGAVSVYQSSRSLSDMAKGDMNSIAASLAGALSVGMQEQLTMIQNISHTNSIVTAAQKAARAGEKSSLNDIALAQAELSKMKDVEGERCQAIALVGKNGNVLASSDKGKMRGLSVAGRDYFEKALKGIPNVGSVVFSKATGTVVFAAASPVYDTQGKSVTGVVAIVMELKYLTDIIDRIKIGKTGFAYLVDQSGLYITHPVKDNILKINIANIAGMEGIVKLIGQKKSGIAEYEIDGIKKAAATAYEPLTGWSIIAAVPTEELYAPAGAIRTVILVTGLAFLILGSGFFYFFARSISRPLTDVVGAAQQIAGGNLTVDVAGETREDEIGSLARAYAAMIHSLREKALIAEKIAASDLTVDVRPLSDADSLGQAFATMVEKLRSQIQQVIEGVNVLASAGTEIMASVSQLTSGATETATSVSETTTTVEEVKQTAEVSNRKAKHVSDLGHKTLEISKTGQKAIEDTVDGMNRIREQMDSIADMVVKLSEQSQAIGEIIASVNDIAEQSNLLAVNASIEAAKAGDQGKGFAVVAQEIRSLAAQSKQATTQVRNILFDVQKAISSAVMATERGNKAVDEGVRLSHQSGEAIDILAHSVQESTDAAMQIAASSQQQLVGMDQVASAMENIREASAQTAITTRQTERAAHDLHNLGQKLQDIVKLYRV